MKWIRVYMVIGLLIWTSNNYAQAVDLCDLNNNNIAHKPRADVTHNPSLFTPANRIQIPLTIDMAKWYNIGALPLGTELDAQIGLIEIDDQSRVFYNNKEITSDIHSACSPIDNLIETLSNEDQQTTQTENE